MLKLRRLEKHIEEKEEKIMLREQLLKRSEENMKKQQQQHGEPVKLIEMEPKLAKICLGLVNREEEELQHEERLVTDMSLFVGKPIKKQRLREHEEEERLDEGGIMETEETFLVEIHSEMHLTFNGKNYELQK